MPPENLPDIAHMLHDGTTRAPMPLQAPCGNVRARSSARIEVLSQCREAVWDGNIASKTERDELHKSGLVTRSHGFNIVTEKGIEYLVNLGLLRA